MVAGGGALCMCRGRRYMGKFCISVPSILLCCEPKTDLKNEVIYSNLKISG